MCWISSMAEHIFQWNGLDDIGEIIMRSILEELFYGNVCPNTDCRSKDKETKELIGYIADHHSALNETLTDKQKEIFEKFNDCYDELTDINEREIFVYAFRLGMRIAIESLSADV